MILLNIQGPFPTNEHYYRHASAPVEQRLISTAKQQGAQKDFRNIPLAAL